MAGSAQILAQGGTSVDGFAIFHYDPSQQEAVVPLETRNAASYVLPFDNTNGVLTGVQTEIEHLMKQGYPDWAAREVALPLFILLPPEVDADGLDEEQREELAEKEREYRRNPPVYLDEGDPNE